MTQPRFFRGEWLESGDGDLAAAGSVFNGLFATKPAIVARCRGAADVATALAHARESGLEVAVRSTGYSLAGYSSTEGMVIDLSLMRGVRVDPKARTAWIEGGVRGGDIQIEAARHDLGATTGMLSGTGVGLILGGGLGHLSRRAGMASDNVLAVEMVTAAGEVVTASPEENPDLFWAVRGTTGNFGVVTALKMQLHEVPPQVLMGALGWTGEQTRPAIEAFKEATTWTSEELNLLGMLVDGGFQLWLCHSGDPAVAEEEVARLAAALPPEEDERTKMPFRDLHFVYDADFAPQRVALEEESVVELSDELVELLIERISVPLPEGSEASRQVEIAFRDGAFVRPPAHASALRDDAERSPYWSVAPGSWWPDAAEDEVHESWLRDLMAAIRECERPAGALVPSMLGLVPDEERVAGIYGDRIDRLRELKSRWDPDNVFRSNVNIAPR